jgi:hypothetical protein
MTSFIRRRGPGGPRRLIAGVIAALAAVTVMVAPASVANAATAQAQPAVVQPLSSPTDCRNTVSAGQEPLCFWVDANFVGKMGVVYGVNDAWLGPDFAQAACKNGTWNDCASALFDASTKTAIVFMNVGRKVNDAFQCIAPGTSAYENLANRVFPQNAKTMNDQISSNEWATSAAECP